MVHDIKFAFRTLARHPGFALLAAFTLGIGIALVATQYSLIDGVMLRPLPYDHAERIYHVSRAEQGQGGQTWSPVKVEEYEAVRAQQGSFEKLAAFQYGMFNLVHDAVPPRRLQGNAVSAEFFDVLSTRPALGRTIRAGEDRPGQPLVVVLADTLWHDEFGADPAIVGRTVTINGELGTVVGVMPPGFNFPGRDDCWANLRAAPAAPGADYVPRVEMIGRVKEGVAPESAAQEIGAILGRVAAASPTGAAESAPRARVVHVPTAYGGDGNTTTLFASMLAMTLLVLLLACVNVANLLFVRSAERLRELAVRNALGAGHARIVRQLVIESLALATLGAAIGAALAAVAVRALEAATHTMLELPSWMHFDLNARVLLVIVGVSALAGLVAGIAPALRAARVEINEALRDAGGGRVISARGSRLGRWMIALQLAFACTALVLASLLAQSVVRTSRANLEFDPDSILAGRIELQAPAYDTAADRSRFYERLLERVRATPGVAAAAVSSRDLAAPGVFGAVEIEGVAYARESDHPGAFLEVVSRDYFRVVDRGALAGRLFDTTDRADSPRVALVNRRFAEMAWPGQDPIGRRLKRGEGDSDWATVVGVAPDLHIQGVGNGAAGPGYYLLQDQMGWGWLDLLVRAERDPAALVGAVRAAVAEVDPKLPIHTIGTVAQRTDRASAAMRLIGGMTVVFAIAALALAAIGIYGVMAFATRVRTREIGVRVALGSSGAAILGLLLRMSLPQTLTGIALGLGFGYALARPLQPVLGSAPSDEPLVFVAIAALLAATALFACVIPARRAAGADPVKALRAE